MEEKLPGTRGWRKPPALLGPGRQGTSRPGLVEGGRGPGVHWGHSGAGLEFHFLPTQPQGWGCLKFRENM